MHEDAVFIPRDGRFLATELARGPWDPGAQHGGAPAALLMRAFERLDGAPALAMARVTYELLRPVPLAELAVEARVLRSGRRVQLLEGAITDGDGTELVRARGLQVLRAGVPGTGSEPVPALGAARGGINLPRAYPRGIATFATDAMDISFVDGAFDEVGPATAWFRMRHPLVAGEEPSGLQRLAAAGDFGNGISAVVSWEENFFINPDLTLYIEREPVGEWICLQSRTRVADGGIGVSESTLFDEQGQVGRAVQALLVGPRSPTSGETP